MGSDTHERPVKSNGHREIEHADATCSTWDDQAMDDRPADTVRQTQSDPKQTPRKHLAKLECFYFHNWTLFANQSPSSDSS
jgi:hypothetical protein